MSLSRRDLYHIEFEQSENISIYEVKYRANEVCISKNGLHLNLMPRNMDMSKDVERKPPLPKGRGTTEGGGEKRPLPKGERATKWRGDSIWKESTMLI